MGLKSSANGAGIFKRNTQAYYEWLEQTDREYLLTFGRLLST